MEGIERSILKNKKISEAVVVLHAENLLSAFIIVIPDGTINTAEVKKELEASLPDYMVPSSIIVLDSFPRLGNEKIDVQKLLEVKINSSVKHAEMAIAPRDVVELMISHIWKQVLKIDYISINDNYFEIGGNSLMAIELIGKINKHFLTEFSIAVMFESNTISLLAYLIRNNIPIINNSNLVLLKRGTAQKTIFIVHPAGGHILCIMI